MLRNTIQTLVRLGAGCSFIVGHSAWAQSSMPMAGPYSPSPATPDRLVGASLPPPASDGFATVGDPAPPLPPTNQGGPPPLDADPSSVFGGGLGGALPLLNPTVGNAVFRADYRSTWLPSASVIGQGTSLGYVEQDLGIRCPFWQDANNEWTGSLHVRNELFQTHAFFPDTGQSFPEELWDIRLATSYRHLFENGWIAGATVSIGSASDRPFAGIGEMTAGVNAFLRVPSGDHNAWLFSLSYSSNSEVPIPIPGVAYVWQPADNLVLNLGLPFMVMYRPTDDLTLECSYMLLTTVHARASYRLCKPVRIYAGYDWNNESYLPVDRPDVNDRLFYFNQKLSAGVRATLSKNVALDLSSGYVFDRYYFEGHSLSDSNHDRIDLGDAPFVSLQCQVHW